METTLTRVPKGTFVMQATPLANTLVSLGITPFDPESVDAYKAAMVEKHPPSFWYEHREKIESSVEVLRAVTAIVILICVAVAALSFAGFVVTGVSEQLFDTNLHSEIYGSVMVGSIVLGCISGLMFTHLDKLADGDITIPVRGPAQWRTLPFDFYRRLGKMGIPPDVERMQQQISSMFPGARFDVDELQQGEYPLDPFLVVSDSESNERYYVAQWGEPLFQNKRS